MWTPPAWYHASSSANDFSWSKGGRISAHASPRDIPPKANALTLRAQSTSDALTRTVRVLVQYELGNSPQSACRRENTEPPKRSHRLGHWSEKFGKAHAGCIVADCCTDNIRAMQIWPGPPARSTGR